MLVWEIKGFAHAEDVPSYLDFSTYPEIIFLLVEKGWKEAKDGSSQKLSVNWNWNYQDGTIYVYGYIVSHHT